MKTRILNKRKERIKDNYFDEEDDDSDNEQKITPIPEVSESTPSS